MKAKQPPHSSGYGSPSKKDRARIPAQVDGRPDLRPSEENRRRRALRFVVVFAVILVLFQVLFVVLIAPSAFFTEYLGLNARLSTIILKILGSEVQVSGDMILSPVYSLRIQRGCDAFQPCGIFVGAVLAFPATLWAKAGAIGIGCLFLSLVNLGRIVSLYYVGIHYPQAFELVHEAIWPALFIVLAFVIWVVWIQRVVRRSSPPIPSIAAR